MKRSEFTLICTKMIIVILHGFLSSLFEDPERILRRFYVFTEEPRKSTITTSEPCSTVFKEAQPRPSEHSNLEYHINNLNLYLHVFGLLIIYCCNKKHPTGL